MTKRFAKKKNTIQFGIKLAIVALLLKSGTTLGKTCTKLFWSDLYYEARSESKFRFVI